MVFRVRDRAPGLFWAIFPIVATLLLLMFQLFVVGGGPHVPLIFGIAIVALVGRLHGFRWHEMQAGMTQAIASAVPVMGIMLTVGMVIGTWILCGTVPLLTTLGLWLLSPWVFLPATCVICAVVSLATGTSWGTVGTMGLALIGIGESMGVPPYVSAGAIVSGAWFGDKLSPLSDSTNFSAAVVGVELYAHIRNLLATTVPSILLALLAYAVLGSSYVGAALAATSTDTLLRVLAETFRLNALLLLPPAVVAITIVRRVPALPGIFSGVVAAGAVAVLVQGAAVGDVMAAMMNGYVADTGDPLVDRLLTKGGLVSMLPVILLIMVAMAFGGVLEKTGCLDTILKALIPRLNTRFKLFAAALLSTAGINVASNIFVALAVAGRMYAPVFRGRGYAAANVSRILEDGGTMTSALIPWNAGGVFVAGTLGVPTLAYAPFAFANWLAIVFDLLWSWLGIFTPRADDTEFGAWARQGDGVFFEGRILSVAELPEGFRSNLG